VRRPARAWPATISSALIGRNGGYRDAIQSGASAVTHESGMDDHLWPSLYPGIIVGILYGLGIGGWRATAPGGAGGLAGAAVAFFAVQWLAVPEGFVTFVASVAAAVAGAMLVLALLRRLADPT
jgi:hypothetical protein